MRSRPDAWQVARLVLLVVAVAVLAYAAAAHRSQASLRELYDDAARGATSQVVLEGGLPPGSTGYAAQTATWETGWRRWVADLEVVRGQDGSGGGDGERTQDDVAAELRRLGAGVTVVERSDRSGFTSEVYGVTLPLWLAVPSVAGLLAGLLLLINAPEPWWATRWGWFWLSAVPGGVLAFLLLSGPMPGVPPPRDPDHRVAGVTAFFLALLLGGVLTTTATQLVWPEHA